MTSRVPPACRECREIIEIERRHGFVSSWNFVAEEYPIEPRPLRPRPRRGLRDRPARDQARRQAVREPRDLRGGTAGDPSLPRRVGRGRLPLAGNPPQSPTGCPSSARSTTARSRTPIPFEPQAGGCCSILPFFLGDLVELPITLVQDHTLWEILRRDSIDLWTEKSDWIIANGGLINLITHPDYLDTPARLRMYEEFLEYLGHQRARLASRCRGRSPPGGDRAGSSGTTDGADRGRGAERAAIAWAS